jgi:hypothetical protein
LLAIAADANSVDEMMNSPEIKPSRPVTNTVPVKISLCKSFMRKSSYGVGKSFNYSSTILAAPIVDKIAMDIWIVS